MEALVYVSTAVGAPSPRAVEAILGSARRNNPPLALTGMLRWADAAFAQLLEGPAPALDRMWTVLKADPRHQDLRLLQRWPAAARLFPDWSMASDRLDRRHDWELLRRRDEGAPPEDTCAWLLQLMADARRRRRPGT